MKGQQLVFNQLLMMCGISAPKPEYQFHQKRKWRFDYAWPDKKVALEVEGGIWRKGGGAHSHPSNIKRDIEKYNEATSLGWGILRVAPEDLMKQKTINLLQKTFLNKQL